MDMIDILKNNEGRVSWENHPTYVLLKDHYKSNSGLRRRVFKQDLVKHYGGKCSECGYDKCLDSLTFHHTGDQEKEDEIWNLMRMAKFREAIREAEKCKLLCFNCHMETHVHETLSSNGNNKKEKTKSIGGLCKIITKEIKNK